MPLILGFVLGLLAAVASAREADDACANFAEFRAARTNQFGDHVWSALGDLRSMESSCIGTDNEWWRRTTTGQLESFVLNHQVALERFSQPPRQPMSTRFAVPRINADS